jgi:hypothetical protein
MSGKLNSYEVSLPNSASMKYISNPRTIQVEVNKLVATPKRPDSFQGPGCFGLSVDPTQGTV